jgi:hypothetical protein
MSPEADPIEFLGRQPDERLLGEELSHLPTSVGLPEELPLSPTRRRIVAFGATMTGVTLIGGAALILFGLIDLIAGGSAIGFAVALVLGFVLVSTHWGWVHVAELTANNIEGHRNASLIERRRVWLEGIEPYPRWEVSTSVGDDGSITILTVRYRPIVRGEGAYTFLREEVAREVHSGDEPAAAVTERAELLRRQAAIDTQEARERYETAHEAYEHALLEQGDEEQRRAAVRAASEALSERINANLRDPPLVE